MFLLAIFVAVALGDFESDVMGEDPLSVKLPENSMSDVSLKLPEKALNKVEYRRSEVGGLTAEVTYAGNRYIPKDAAVMRRAPASNAYAAASPNPSSYEAPPARRRNIGFSSYGPLTSYSVNIAVTEAHRRRLADEDSLDNYGLQIAHDGTDFAGTYEVQFPERRMMTVSYDMNEAKDGYTAKVYYTGDLETKVESRRAEVEAGTYDARGINVEYTVDGEVFQDGFEASLMFDPLLRRAVPFEDLLNTQAMDDGEVFPKQITPSLSRRRMIRRLGRANGRFDMDLSMNF